MWDLQAALEVSQTALGAVSCLYFVGSQFKQAEVRKRNRTPFIYVLIAMLLTLLAEQGVLIVSTGGMPDLPPLAAVILYTLTLILQIDRLCPCTAEDKNREPAWHAYFGSWAAMFVFDMVAIIKLTLTTRSLTLDLVCGVVATSLRSCMELVLLVVSARPDKGGYIRLHDDTENDDSNDQGGGNSEPSALGRSVSDEIHDAGGLWSWLKKFQIFLPWIWPSGVPWAQLCILASLVLLLGKTALTLFAPRLYSAYTESLSQAFADKKFDLILPPFISYMAIEFSSFVLSYFQQGLWEKFKVHRHRLACSSIYRHIMDHDAAFHVTTNSTDINTAIDNGVIICATLDFLLLDALPQMITLVIASTTIFWLFGPHVALVQASVIALDAIIVLRSNRTWMPMLDAQMIAHQETRRRREGGLRAWTTVALCGQVERETDAYTSLLHTETALEWKGYICRTGFQFSSNVTVRVGIFCATALAIQYGIQTGGGFGSVVMFGNYWILMQEPLMFFTRIPKRLSRDLYTGDRLRRLLAARPEMQYGTAALQLTGGGIELKNVSFSYPDASGKVKPVFKDLTLSIVPGETVAFVGPSGVGKSTIFSLITRQFDPDEGSVEIDGQDIRSLQKGALVGHMAIMAQEPHILDDTVRNNIKFGQPGATDAEMHAAAKMASIHDDIIKWEKQYDRMVGENGRNISGGQKQRVALARTFLRDSPIMLLDEATSAIDADTEACIRRSVKNRRKTTLIIAHRLSSAMHADRLIVFGKGEDGCGMIAEEGTHEKLVARDGVYARLWKNSTETKFIEQLFNGGE